MSTKWPPTVLLVEPSEELRHQQVSLAVDWVPQDGNQEADDLSNMKVDGLAPERQIHARGQDLVWKVLPELMAAAQTLYEQRTAERDAANDVGPRPRRWWARGPANDPG